MAQQRDLLHETYHVQKSLGEGAGGAVFRGVLRQGGGRWHALKFLSTQGYDRRREVDVLRRLQTHPGIIEFLGVFDVTPDRKEIVLALPEMSCTLHSFIGRDPTPMNHCMAGGLARQCLSALGHMHRLRIVHRDLAPANLLLDFTHRPCDNAGQATASIILKVADFSRSRLLLDEVIPTNRTRCHTKAAVDVQGWRVGPEQVCLMSPGIATPVYAAPELTMSPWTEVFAYGTAVDIWSFGAIWFELLTGERFVEARSDACIVASIVCRLGPLPDEFPVPNAAQKRVEAIWKAATEKVSQFKSSCKPLSNYSRQGEPGWPVLRASLRWIGTRRQHAAALQQLWPATTMISSVAVNFCTALPLEVATLPSQQQQMSSDKQDVFRLLGAYGDAPQPAPLAATQGMASPSHCQSAGHCYTPGHRYHGGCKSTDFVRCVCGIIGCLRPRLHGEFFHQHKAVS